MSEEGNKKDKNGTNQLNIFDNTSKDRKTKLTNEKIEWFNKLNQIEIPKTVISEEFKNKFGLKKSTLEELVKKANLKQLEEIYKEYRFAGKTSITLLYIESFKSYTKDELLSQINGRILAKLKAAEYIEIPSNFVEMNYEQIYVTFNNFKERILVYDTKNKITEERNIPDYPVIVFQESNPIVQIRSNINSSILLWKKILERYLPKHEDFSCNFDNPKFREKVLKKFKRATSIGLEKSIQEGTAQKVQISDPKDVLRSKDYKWQKEHGAVEKYVYLIDYDGKKIAVQINFDKNKLIFKKYSSEKMINEVLECIMGIANESRLYENRIRLPKFLNQDS